MTRPLVLLTTCGTSLLTNGADDELRRWLNERSNDTTLPPDEQARLDSRVADRRRELLEGDTAVRRKLSAELNGAAAVIERTPGRVEHLLVHTDTLSGRAAAEIVREVLEADGTQVQMLTASGLRTDDLASFRAALSDLTRQLETYAATWHSSGAEVVFNLTGGFKSLNAYVQALGMLHGYRCIFQFESAPVFMEIPRLPVDWAVTRFIADHLTTFRRMALRYPVTPAEASGIPDALLMEVDGEVTTSEWGDMLWPRVRLELYQQALIEPLTARLRYSPQLEKRCRDLSPDRLLLVNQQLDALAEILDERRKPLKSETFKPLSGNPCPPSTHEMYAWSDRDARRLVGHFEPGGRVFVVDDLIKHL